MTVFVTFNSTRQKRVKLWSILHDVKDAAVQDRLTNFDKYFLGIQKWYFPLIYYRMWYGDLIIFPAIFNTQNMGLIVFTKFLGTIQVLHKPLLALLSGQWTVKYLLMSKLWINLFNPPRLSEQCFNELGINNILVLSNYQIINSIIKLSTEYLDVAMVKLTQDHEEWSIESIEISLVLFLILILPKVPLKFDWNPYTIN